MDIIYTVYYSFYHKKFLLSNRSKLIGTRDKSMIYIYHLKNNPCRTAYCLFFIILGSSSSNFLEIEISPLEVFQDVGIMVVEGRLPEISKNGRQTGVHSWPISKDSKKSCCQSISRHEVYLSLLFLFLSLAFIKLEKENST